MRAQNDFYWTERVKPLIAVCSGTERERGDILATTTGSS